MIFSSIVCIRETLRACSPTKASSRDFRIDAGQVPGLEEGVQSMKRARFRRESRHATAQNDGTVGW